MKSIQLSSIIMMAIALLVVPTIASAKILTSQLSKNEILIQFNASELNTAEGLANLEQQIRSAAKTVCGRSFYTETRSLKDQSAARQCYENSVSDAMENLQSGATQLTVR